VYQLLLDSRAQRDLDRLKGSAFQRVCDALAGLRAAPRPAGCKKLRGVADAYRIRVGDYRIVYEVQDAAGIVKVRRVQHRKDICREL
jgi:mRNA interferase RelE/StbE